MSELIQTPRVCVECYSKTSSDDQWYNKATSKFFRGVGYLCKSCYERLRPRVQKHKSRYDTVPCRYCGKIIDRLKSNFAFCNKICQKKYRILT